MWLSATCQASCQLTLLLIGAAYLADVQALPIHHHHQVHGNVPSINGYHLVGRQIELTTTVTPTITPGAGGGGLTNTPVGPAPAPAQAPTQAQTQTRVPVPADDPVPAPAPTQAQAGGATQGFPAERVTSLATPTTPPPPPSRIQPTLTSAPGPAQSPSQSTSSGAGGGEEDEEDQDGGGSGFPENLSWWQILGIALACVGIVGLLVYMLMRRRNRQRQAEKKDKEAKAEEGRRAREDAERRREDSRANHRMVGMPMNMGMGGFPIVLGGNGGGDGGGGGGGRRGRRRRYDDDDDSDESWESSGSESYDDVSDGGTIRKRRRRRPRRRKDRRDRRRGGRRKDDYSSDDSSASDTSFYAKPRTRKERRRERERDRYGVTPKSSKHHTPKSHHGQDLPMGLGPPTASATTPPSGNSKRKTFRDSVFSSYHSMKRAAVRHKYMDNKVRLQKQLEEEEAIERQRQDKIREANEAIEREKERERVQAMKEKEQRSAQQIAALFAPRRQATMDSMRTPAPQIPMPQPKPSYRQDTPPATQTSAVQIPRPAARRQQSSPASAYNSALPDRQQSLPRPDPPKRSSSELAYAYDGVASVVSSAAGGGGGGGKFQRSKPPMFKPPVRRQDSNDPPLKSAMRTPGTARRPQRKATINDKTATIRPKMPYKAGSASDSTTGSGSAKSNDFQSDWLSRPPLPGASTRQDSLPRPTSAAGSVTLPVPHPKDRPIIAPGGLAPAPPPRARTRSGTSQSTQSSNNSKPGGGTDNAIGVGGLKWIGAGGSQQPAANRWANRLRERK